jgi:hypothetical protein
MTATFPRAHLLGSREAFSRRRPAADLAPTLVAPYSPTVVATCQ